MGTYLYKNWSNTVSKMTLHYCLCDHCTVNPGPADLSLSGWEGTTYWPLVKATPPFHSDLHSQGIAFQTEGNSLQHTVPEGDTFTKTSLCWQ